MDTYVISVWVLLGFALSTRFMMHFWPPGPPPDILGKYITILVAGVKRSHARWRPDDIAHVEQLAQRRPPR